MVAASHRSSEVLRTRRKTSAKDRLKYLDRYALREVPFSTLPSAAYAYAHESMVSAHQSMRDVVIGRSGFGMVSGEVGLGKTTLARVMHQDLESDRFRSIYFPNVPGGVRQTEASIMREIATNLGLSNKSGNSADAYYRDIADVADEEAQSESTTVIIIDDAQDLKSTAVRALLRLLALQSNNEQLIQVLLFGQNPELLSAVTADRALHSRLSAHVELTPFNEQEVAEMLAHRLKVAGRNTPLFTAEGVSALARVSGGIPRSICRAAHQACIVACGRDADLVDAPDVEKAARTLHLDLLNRTDERS